MQTNTLKQSVSEKLSIKEKVGYALGDTAANFVFQTMILLQLAFYTDTFGITAAAAGTLLLVARFWDAIFDPIMGIIADKTNTKWGKFRPWILWTAVPFGIMGFLAFLTPDFSPSGKLIYAYITYIVLMTIYSANNLPYSSLSGVMTGDLADRTSLSQYRFVFAMIAQLVIQSLALPMVSYFGGSNSAVGYSYTMGIFSVLAIIFFFITFATTKERITPDPDQKATVAQHFKDLKSNGPWLAMFFVTLLLFITLAMRGSVIFYYFRYFVTSDDYTTTFSLFNLFGTISTIIGIFFSKKLSLKFGKRNVFMSGIAGTAIFCVPFAFFGSQSLGLMFGTEIIRQFIYGLTIPLLWAMMADVADYSEWKNKRRATGIVFSAIVFALKAGLGFGGAITGYLLSFYGYMDNVQQTDTALNGIIMIMSIFPAISFGICAVCLFFYKIDKNLEIQVNNELAERRKNFAAGTP